MKIEDINRDVIIESLVQAIPHIGGPLANLYFGHKQERRFKRLEQFYQELQKEIAILKETFPDISSHNPEELSAILEVLNDKIETEHLKNKLRYYKEYFKNTMRFPVNKNFDERKLFLDILSALTPLQIELVILLSEQSVPVPGSGITKPGVDQAVIIGSMAQLKTFGIIEGTLASIVIGGGSGGLNEDFLLSRFGRMFHAFCLNS
jgi:hypothetical protein